MNVLTPWKIPKPLIYPSSSEASIVRELYNLRDKLSHGILSHDEIILLIDDICVN